MIKDINEAAGAPRLMGPYSYATEAGGFLYTSALIGITPEEGKLVEGAGEQTTLALSNLEAILAAAGLSMDDAVKITVYVPDIRDFPKVNMAYANFFKGRRMPARTAVGVPNLPMPGARVSIDVIAKTRD